jgi:hypothetical protein
MSYKTLTQIRSNKVLNSLKVAHEIFTWNGRKYHIVGRYGGHKWHGFWLKFWMHEKHSLSVQSLG